MNKKGFTLIELIVGIAIIGILMSLLFTFLEDEKIVQKTGALVKFKQEVKPIVKNKTIILDKCGIKCIGGKKIIEIDGIVYYLGTIKNSWGDLETVDCD